MISHCHLRKYRREVEGEEERDGDDERVIKVEEVIMLDE